MNLNRRRIAVLALAGVLVVAAVYGFFVFERPSVESVDNEWGAVEENRSEVRTEIAVDNPWLLGVADSAANVEYTVALNDVVFATEEEKRVSLGDDDTLTTSTWVNNDRIPEWWVTHVNNDETTTVTVDPSVVVRFAGVKLPAESLTRNRTFQTDLLAPLQTEETRRFSAYGRTVFVVNETNAQWGQATTERTPVNASATVTNSLPVPVPVTEVQYTVRMNGVVVGTGQAAEQTVIPAESTRTLEARAFIDNSKLDEWWVTHLRNDQTTRMSVAFDATVRYGGVERTLPLEFLSYNRTFQTDVFGSASTGNQSESRGALPDELSASPGSHRSPAVAATRG